LNKIVVIAAAAAAAAVVAGLFFASRGQPEVAFHDENNTRNDFRLTEFLPVQGFTAEQVRDIGRQVCGGVGREDWLPQEVAFAYLEPGETVYRIPCGHGPPGYFYRSFYFSAAGPAIIDEYHPNEQSLFEIASPNQAAEYVMYFDIVLAGEQGNKQFVLTEEQYDRWAEQCIKDNNTSAVKELTVTHSGDDHTAELNFVDNVSGSFEYRKYLVGREGAIELLAEKSLGDCGFAI
jgi:hypothetical protein